MSTVAAAGGVDGAFLRGKECGGTGAGCSSAAGSLAGCVLGLVLEHLYGVSGGGVVDRCASGGALVSRG
eukprot:919030-Rhodomonas_salina.1